MANLKYGTIIKAVNDTFLYLADNARMLLIAGKANDGKSTIVRALVKRAAERVLTGNRLLPCDYYMKLTHFAAVRSMLASFLAFVLPHNARSQLKYAISKPRGGGREPTEVFFELVEKRLADQSIVASIETHLLSEWLEGTHNNHLDRIVLAFNALSMNSSPIKHIWEIAHHIHALMISKDPGARTIFEQVCAIPGLFEPVVPFLADKEAKEAITKLTTALRRGVSGIISVQTENMSIGYGGIIRAVSETNEFEVILPSRRDNTSARWKVTANPKILAKACAFFAVLHVGTISSRYGEGIEYATTLSGGLSEAILLTSQEFSDLAVSAGACVFCEIRDDFTKSKIGSIDELYDKAEINDPSIKRLLATTQEAIYTLELGKFVYRHRAMSHTPIGDVQDQDITVTFEFDLDDLPTTEGSLVPSGSDFEETIDHARTKIPVFELS